MISTTTSSHPRDEIHVWVRPSAPSLEEYHALPASERERADGILSPAKRAQFITGRALARRVLAIRLRTAPHDVPIVTTDTGRPRLTGDMPFDFSISHARGLVVVAVARDTRVGVDIEAMKSRCTLHAIAERFFSADELTLLANVAQEHRSRAFYDIWTCKEAYIKALGLGIFSHLGQTAVDPYVRRVVRGVDGDAPERWRLETLDLSSAHRTSVCWDARNTDAWHICVHEE